MIKAVIFDMDGVISDTNYIHAQIESDLLKDSGIYISKEEIIEKYAGYKVSSFFEELLAKNNIKCDLNKLLKDKHDIFVSILENDRIKSIPGAVDLIAKLKESNFKLAVASGTEEEIVRMILEKLGVLSCFDVIISADEVEHGKPRPDIFILTAEKLSVTPAECVVIEDSKNGIAAAKAAGMKCIGLTNDKTAPADLIINSFDEINIDIIKNL